MAKLHEIEGIGATYAAKLEAAGVATLEQLLNHGSSQKGRSELAEKTGIGDALILKWVNRADLARVKGVGSEYADLLELAGVDSVPELGQRSPENLHQKLAQVNANKKAVRQTPSQRQVENWVTQAKELPRVVTH